MGDDCIHLSRCLVETPEHSSLLTAHTGALYLMEVATGTVSEQGLRLLVRLSALRHKLFIRKLYVITICFPQSGLKDGLMMNIS